MGYRNKQSLIISTLGSSLPIAIDCPYGEGASTCTLHVLRACMHAEHIGALPGTKRFARQWRETGETSLLHTAPCHMHSPPCSPHYTLLFTPFTSVGPPLSLCGCYSIHVRCCLVFRLLLLATPGPYWSSKSVHWLVRSLARTLVGVFSVLPHSP